MNRISRWRYGAGRWRRKRPAARALRRAADCSTWLGLALLIASLADPGAFGARRAPKDAEESPGPEVRLTVSPRNGFSPLNLTLNGHLSGVGPNDEQFCHPGVEWEWRSPDGLIATSKENPRCLHPPERVEVPTSFTKVVTLSAPGTYVYRLILHRRDGGKVISNTQEVRVLSSR